MRDYVRSAPWARPSRNDKGDILREGKKNPTRIQGMKEKSNAYDNSRQNDLLALKLHTKLSTTLSRSSLHGIFSAQ